MFMDEGSITECIRSLKMKNSEGFDQISQRGIADGADFLLLAFTKQFKLNYDQALIPSQWLITKTIFTLKYPFCPFFLSLL